MGWNSTNQMLLALHGTLRPWLSLQSCVENILFNYKVDSVVIIDTVSVDCVFEE